MSGRAASAASVEIDVVDGARSRHRSAIGWFVGNESHEGCTLTVSQNLYLVRRIQNGSVKPFPTLRRFYRLHPVAQEADMKYRGANFAAISLGLFVGFSQVAAVDAAEVKVFTARAIWTVLDRSGLNSSAQQDTS